MCKAVVFLSGSGRTLENFLQKINSGKLPIEIVAVVSSSHTVRGNLVAQAAKIDLLVFPRREYESIDAHNLAINNAIEKYKPNLILLAGYLCFYQIPDWFKGFALNIHPALLPKYGGKGFYGDRVHSAVLESGDKETGCTVHHVSDQYDKGLIVAQKKVPVLPDDTVDELAKRVFEAECDLYPDAILEVVRRANNQS